MPRSPPAVRPSWRLTPGKALSHRFEAPTFCPRARRPSARVGASPPAKSYATVSRRQLFAPEPAFRPPELAPHPGKALCHRSEAPTFCPRARRWIVRVGASPPGKSLCHRFEAPTFCPRVCRWGARVGASPSGKALNYRHEATTRLPSLWLNLRKMLSSCESCRCMNGPICLELQTCIKK